MTATEKLTKNEIAKRLVAHDIILTPQQVKRAAHADLVAQLVIADERAAAEAAKAAADVRESLRGKNATRADIAAAADAPVTVVPPKATGRRPRKQRVHRFDSTGDAYDACQCRDDIATGDILLIRSEGVVGLAWMWPVAVTEERGKLHGYDCPLDQLTDEATGLPVFTAAQVEAGRDYASRMTKPAPPKPVRTVEPGAEANVVKLPRKSPGINIAPKPLGQQKPCREHTIQAAFVDLLATGATIWELQGAAPKWTESSIRSGMHYDMHSVKGYGIRTVVMTPRQAYDDGHEAHCENDLGTEREHEAFVQVYFLVLPEGMSEPLRHTEAAPMKRAANKG